ncbi:MAG: PTS transporter subunit IIC [Bacilli bacterium]
MKKIQLFGLSPFQFFLTSMNGMVYGLFATLIISVILNQLGLLLNFPITESLNLGTEITKISGIVRSFLGVGIGVGIAWALKLQGLKLIGAMVIGGLSTASGLALRADPLVAYVTTISALLLVELIFKKKTPFDIILIPLVSILFGTIFTLIYFNPISSVATAIGEFVNAATTLQPILMGVAVSVLMGIILTSPFSSAGIAISFGISGLAGGAAVVGCAVNMLGFAVMGRKDNDLGTTISVGLGTSMLQFKNAMKTPTLWLPVIIVSAILGPVSTTVFQTLTDAVGAGMGTSGLVGQFATLAAMEDNLVGALLSIFVLQIALPIALVWVLDTFARKWQWYKPGDLKI